MLRDRVDWLKESLYFDLGRFDYEPALVIQKKLHQLRINHKIPDSLILVEHPAVITIGKSGNPANLLVSADILKRKGIEIYRIERGGDITFHGPGQLVGYPIFYIKQTLAGIRGMIEKLESVLIQALTDFGISAVTKPKLTGVWVGNEKVASIGIAVKKWVTFHGFALNVTTDLTYFDLIRPCGLKDVKMTSIEKISGRRVDLSAVKERILLNGEKIFETKFRSKKFSAEFAAQPDRFDPSFR